jgi:hypothetical protein
LQQAAIPPQNHENILPPDARLASIPPRITCGVCSGGCLVDPGIDTCERADQPCGLHALLSSVPCSVPATPGLSSFSKPPPDMLPIRQDTLKDTLKGTVPDTVLLVKSSTNIVNVTGGKVLLAIGGVYGLMPSQS